MAAPKFEATQPSWEKLELEQCVHQLGVLYGISGLEVAITPGVGTSCAKLDKGLLITIDPQQVIGGHENNLNNPDYGVTTPEIDALFMTAHELGHAKDFLDPAWRPAVQKTKSRAFFDCLVDDTVIDKRSRRVPLFDAKADAVYAHQIPSDVRELPKHVQLMYGIRINTVMKNPQLAIDPEIQDILTQLSYYEKGGQVFDIPAVLTNPRTTLIERRHIADTFILPYFEALLEEDKQEQQDGNSKGGGEGEGDSKDESSEGESGDEVFEKIYEQYDQATHGDKPKDEAGNDQDSNGADGQEAEDGDQTGKRQGQGEESEESSSKPDLSEQMSEALKQIADEQKAEKAAKAKERASSADSDPYSQKQRQAKIAELTNTVATEMNLSQGDAKKYVESLDRWGSTIKEVADVFMQLASPAEAIMSPRYDRGAHTKGLRLHPSTMAGVALQIASGQEQAIWQPVERRARRQDITFGGLDVHLLLDVSSSMQGDNAQCAADTALCLIEGLQLARYKVSREVGQSHQPDVRTQIIAFGASNDTLSPLSYSPTDIQKGATYTNLINPDSPATYVAGALVHVKTAANAKPKRDSIAIVVSDGEFHDHDIAAELVKNMPKSAYVVQLVIGSDVTSFISEHHEELDDPSALPGKLYGELMGYIRRSQ